MSGLGTQKALIIDIMRSLFSWKCPRTSLEGWGLWIHYKSDRFGSFASVASKSSGREPPVPGRRAASLVVEACMSYDPRARARKTFEDLTLVVNERQMSPIFAPALCHYKSSAPHLSITLAFCQYCEWRLLLSHHSRSTLNGASICI